MARSKAEAKWQNHCIHMATNICMLLLTSPASAAHTAKTPSSTLPTTLPLLFRVRFAAEKKNLPALPRNTIQNTQADTHTHTPTSQPPRFTWFFILLLFWFFFYWIQCCKHASALFHANIRLSFRFHFCFVFGFGSWRVCVCVAVV